MVKMDATDECVTSEEEIIVNDSDCVGLKRQRNSEAWKRNVAKKLRNSGKMYISVRTGKKIPAKKFKPVESCCKKRCCQSLQIDQQKELFVAFWDCSDKVLQDAILIGYISKKEKQTTSLKPEAKERNYYLMYTIKHEGFVKIVCQKFLRSLLQISEMRLRSVQNTIKTGAIPEDKRGKHHNRPNKIENKVWHLVEEHLSQFPHKESHYSSARTKRMYFDNPELTVHKLYTCFRQHFYELEGKPLTMKYSTYHRYWREHSQYSFRQPRSDRCDFCAECEVLLAKNPDDQCKVTYNLHKARAKAYQSLKADLMKEIKSVNDDRILFLEFDYAQNLPIPKLNVTSQFYKRLLWLYNFNVHCHNDGTSSFYYFLEIEARKNPQSVCSCLYDFIQKMLAIYVNVKKIVFFSDSCGGQNKNIAVVMFSSWLAKHLRIEIEHIFPVRGHSYNQCDRNFGKYGTLVKRVENLEVPAEYVKMMEECRANPKPFNVINAASMIKDWSKGLAPMFFKTPRAKGYRFTIQKYCRLHYSQRGVVSGSYTYTPVYHPFTFFNHSSPFLSFTELNLRNEPKPGINLAKKTDVLSLCKFLKPQNAEWLTCVLNTKCVINDAPNNMSDVESESED